MIFCCGYAPREKIKDALTVLAAYALMFILAQGLSQVGITVPPGIIGIAPIISAIAYLKIRKTPAGNNK